MLHVSGTSCDSKQAVTCERNAGLCLLISQCSAPAIGRRCTASFLIELTRTTHLPRDLRSASLLMRNNARVLARKLLYMVGQEYTSIPRVIWTQLATKRYRDRKDTHPVCREVHVKNVFAGVFPCSPDTGRHIF